ncbi:Ribokinase-like protein [Ramicandelaber brevisporus]|nr:Ribokinase-like protein [Ramicandelaber brevisporus]
MSNDQVAPRRRVLSVQSHVVSGYVGNRAATFPLQLLGYDVDALNTVQFSNHTGYNTFKGERFPASHLLDLYGGLTTNGLDDYDYLLAGYMGNAANINAVATIVDDLRKNGAQNQERAAAAALKAPSAHEGVFFVLDPVLGDDGVLYVSPDLIPIYKEVLVPRADLLTPNQLEAELLTDTKITSLETALEAIEKLHKMGVPNVVITSAAFESDPDNLTLVGSQQAKKGEEASPKQFTITFPKLDGYYTGTGDLTCALLLARFADELHRCAPVDNAKDGNEQVPQLSTACEQAIATMSAVLLRTYKAQTTAPGVTYVPNLPRSQRPSNLVRACELQLIQSRDDILHPVVSHRAIPL